MITFIVLLIGFGFCGFFGWRLLCRIVCPECGGRDRSAPCEVCGERGTISLDGDNPCPPRGTGFRGTGRMERSVISKVGRTHGKGWSRDRGDNGFIC